MWRWFRAPNRPRRRPRLHIVVVTSDGVRLLQFTVPRWIIRSGAALTCLALGALAFLVADYSVVRASAQASAGIDAQLVAQRETIEQLRAGLDAIRHDLETWPALHAKILSPFGRAAAAADPLRVRGDDADDAAGVVHRATGTLRQIAGLMMRFDGALAQMPSAWPVRAAINSEFGNRRSPWTGDQEFHAGVDIGAGEGTPVHAPAPGAVAFSGPQGTYGLTVIVDHGANVRTRYGHLSRVSVRKGEHVERGQVLGRSGSTGHSTGAHLHYEVLVSGRPVNPRPYLWD